MSGTQFTTTTDEHGAAIVTFEHDENATTEDLLGLLQEAGEHFMAGIESGQYISVPTCSASEDCENPGIVDIEVITDDDQTWDFKFCSSCAAELADQMGIQPVPGSPSLPA